MARRGRRRASRATAGVQLIQIAGLGLLLVIILLFRDNIGEGAGNFFGTFGSEDVQLPEEQPATAPERGQSDAGTDAAY